MYNNFILHRMASFVLSNINLQVEAGIIPPSSRKLLKVESITQKPTPSVALFKLKEPAEVISAQSLQWHETLVLPAKYSTPFSFEIVSEHNRFGYNPEDIESLEGKIVIKRSDKDYTGWEVFREGKKVGYLFANIEVRTKDGVTKSPSKAVENNSSFFGSTIELNGNGLAFLSLYGKNSSM